MKELLQNRLQQLKSEYATGQTVMTELRKKQENLQETLLRISGAIQVLEELLAEERQSETNQPDVAPPRLLNLANFNQHLFMHKSCYSLANGYPDIRCRWHPGSAAPQCGF